MQTLEERRLLAVPIVVDTTDDEVDSGGTTSLREAIIQAQTQVGDDVITFDTTVFASGSLHTINLTRAEPLSLGGANGKITITGPGSDVLAVNGNVVGRSFDVNDGAVADISGMTIRDGVAQGGAFMNGGILTLDHVLITNNKVVGATPVFSPAATVGDPGGDASGGALYNTGTLTIIGSIVSDNLAQGGDGGNGSVSGGGGGEAFGGALYTTGDVTIRDSTFTGNVAAGGAGAASIGTGGIGGTAKGGAIYIAGNSAHVSIEQNSDLTFNQANRATDATGGDSTFADAGAGGTGFGGGIYQEGGNSVLDLLSGSSLLNDSAHGGKGGTAAAGNGGAGAGASGGAVFALATINVTNFNDAFNSATGGAGGVSTAGGNGGEGGNGDGGGFFLAVGSSPTMLDTSFFEDSAKGGAGANADASHTGGNGGNANGGSIFNASSSFTLTEDIAFVTQNVGGSNALGGKAGEGLNPGHGGGAAGGTFFNSGTMSLVGQKLNISAAFGGISRFGAGLAFGGVIFNDGVLHLTNCSIKGGDARGAASLGDSSGASGGDARGGAVYSEGTFTADGCLFENNLAQGGEGGVSTGPVDSTAFGGEGDGGALYIEDTPGAVSNCTFDGNTALGGAGGDAFPGHTAGTGGQAAGGAVLSGTANASTYTDCTFTANSATGGQGGSATTGGNGAFASGGAIFNGAKLTLTGGTLSGNFAQGGDPGSTNGNVAGGARGGAIDSEGIFLQLSGLTLSGNQVVGGSDTSASGLAGAVLGGALSTSNDTDVTLCTFSGNSAHGGNAQSHTPGSGGGGGIFAGAGTLTIASSTITNNAADAGTIGASSLASPGSQAMGGGIFSNAANTTITTSTIDHNVALGGAANNTDTSDGGEGGGATGGGIFANTNFKITNSTVANNLVQGGAGGSSSAANKNGGPGGAGSGGGIYLAGGSFASVNVTIAYNSAVGGAGGTGGAGGGTGLNAHGFGGGIAGSITANIANTIVAKNSADQGPAIFDPVKITFTKTLIDSELFFDANPGSTLIFEFVDTKLGPLADNGGPTKTILPDPGSPAIDAGDNAAAIAEFGANGTDQRGAGFPRIVGSTVDIGSVEASAPMISVSGNGHAITNNDTTPSATDFTDFGSQFRYSQAPTRTFVVTNTGSGTLDLTTVNVPNGYTIVEPLAPSLGAGQSDSFTIQLSTQNPGTFAGNVVISSNDPLNQQFKFKITGTISPTFKINYQPAASPVPVGYVADSGQIFGNRGNGLSYGWNLNAASFTRDRNLNADQARDTLIHTQLFGSRTFEVAVPDGAYQVHLVSGDPGFFDSVYKVNVEGVLVVNGTPTSGNRYVEGTQTVIVTDGRVTIANATGSVNNKLDFVEITPVTTPPIRVNFQTPTSPTPGGFLADSGTVFGNRGNGFSYGWNLSASSFARDRNNPASPDQQHDTFIHTQLYGARIWELALPNGSYSVHLVAGDPNFFDSVYKFNAEGSLLLSGTPSSGNRFVDATKTVAVSDGRLTISNAAGSVNNKIDFIEVTPIIV